MSRIDLSNPDTDGIGQRCFCMKASAEQNDSNGTVYFSVRTSGAYDSGDKAAIKNGTGAVVHVERAPTQRVYALALNLEPDTRYYWGAVCHDGSTYGDMVEDDLRTLPSPTGVGGTPPI